MWWLAPVAWRYRKEIMLGIQAVSEIRKTARDFTREYIQRRIREGMVTGIAMVLFQISLLLSALLWVAVHPSLLSRLVASTLLWTITLYNLYRFAFVTVPELYAVRRTLRGKMGYAMKYFLRISLVTELLHWNLLLPIVCLVIAAITRSMIGTGVSYFAPWVEAFSRLNSLH